MLGLGARRRMVGFQAGAWREGDVGGGGVEAPSGGAEGKELREAGTELRGEGWAGSPGEAVAVLGMSDGFLEG